MTLTVNGGVLPHPLKQVKTADSEEKKLALALSAETPQPQSSSEISRVATADTEEMRTAIALSKSEADMNTRRLSAKDELQDILVNAKMNAHQRMATDEQLTRRADGSLGGMPVAKFDQPKHLPVSFSEQPPPKPGRSKTSTTHSSTFQKKQTFL